MCLHRVQKLKKAEELERSSPQPGAKKLCGEDSDNTSLLKASRGYTEAKNKAKTKKKVSKLHLKPFFPHHRWPLTFILGWFFFLHSLGLEV